jgi:hypothetical protein
VIEEEEEEEEKEEGEEEEDPPVQIASVVNVYAKCSA